MGSLDNLGYMMGALLLASLISEHLVSAWKPIDPPLGSTSFSLKQSHPGAELGSELGALGPATSYSQFDAHKQDDDELLLPRSAVVNGVEGAAVSSLTAQHPISFNDHLDDHYDSYASLEDTIGKDSPLGFTRTPLYGSDRCSVKKFAFNHDGEVEYGNKLPELDQFTMCFWMRFTNHSGDHVLLTYEIPKEPREVQIWVANARNSSFLSMAIKGQQVYRLNYPLRKRQWHHMCSSWNGKTGEWQVWLKAERIGRGFHNSLVGHKIPSNGKLRSGGASVTGDVSQGLHFEVTLIQVYRVALSAGKAHRDHKHHHAHHFDHEGQELSSTTRPPPVINRPQPMNQLLASGQIPTRVRINLANPPQDPSQAQLQPGLPQALPSPQQQQQQQAITINTNFVNGQMSTGSRLIAQQLISLPGANRLPQPRRPIGAATSGGIAGPSGEFHMLSNSANVQFIDETETHIQFKREAGSKADKRQAKGDDDDEKKLQKRGLVLLDDGSLVDDGLNAADEDYSKYNGLADFGGQQFKHDLTQKMNLEEEISTHDREPAEEEVKAVMALCSSCDAEPFQGAIVFAWKDVSDRMNNVLKGSSVGTCGNF